MKGGGRVMEFEQIYNIYFKSVYRYIRKLSGDEHIAEEITSETFLKAMKSIGDFRGECDMRVWLCQIAKNTKNFTYNTRPLQGSFYVACVWRIVFQGNRRSI